MRAPKTVHPVIIAFLLCVVSVVGIWLVFERTGFGSWIREILGYHFSSKLLFVLPIAIAAIYLRKALKLDL